MSSSRMSHAEFEREYLALARYLAGGGLNSEIAQEICRDVYESLSDNELRNPDIVDARFRHHPRRDEIAEARRESERIADYLLGSRANGCRYTAAQLRELATPIISAMTLFDRLIITLGVQGWGNDAIAAIINDSINKMSPLNISPQSLSVVANAITSFQCNAVAAVASHDSDSEWVISVIKVVNVDRDFESWSILRQFSLRNQDVRFQRATAGKTYARIRDRASQAKRILRKELQAALEGRNEVIGAVRHG